MRKYYSLFIFLIIPFGSFAQKAADESIGSLYAQYQLEIVLGVAVLVSVVAVLTLLVALYALRAMTQVREAENATDTKESFWSRIWSKMNDSVPVAQEATVMTSHSYDGIRELDNRLPPWWLYGFYFTILFGAIYLVRVFLLDAPTQAEEYEAEMAQARIEVEAYLATLDNLIDETNVEFTADDLDLAAGMELYNGKCVACHGLEGQGGVGPSFADKYWIHGGDAESVFKTIKYGVPSKGMIAWQAQLSPKEMQQVASYLITFEGTNPANNKEPQGTLFEREDSNLMEAGL